MGGRRRTWFIGRSRGPVLRRFGPQATVRPSIAFYNTTEEIDRMVTVLHKLTADRGGAERRAADRGQGRVNAMNSSSNPPIRLSEHTVIATPPQRR